MKDNIQEISGGTENSSDGDNSRTVVSDKGIFLILKK